MKIDVPALTKIIKQFRNKRVLVVGDFCLDKYIFGEMVSISPEAPIPRIIIKNSKYIPGAAGNVASGTAALGANTVVAGVVGKDTDGDLLIKELIKRKIDVAGLIRSKEYITPVYSRIICGGDHSPKQQIVRLDKENNQAILPILHKNVQQFVLSHVAKVDAILVADYDETGGNGIITNKFMKLLAAKAKKHKKILIGDSRKNLSFFKGFTAVVPNDYEAGHFLGQKISSDLQVIAGGKLLRSKLSLLAAIITRGKDGISVFEKKGYFHHKTVAKEVFDVTGAGDTVSCVIALALASGASFSDAAQLANYGASVTVSKEGTVSVTGEEIEEVIKRNVAVETASKQITRTAMTDLLAILKKQKKKIVFLNGYFDPLHIGHIQLLTNAKKYGDVLIVGLNSDQSVRENKGPDRPFLDERKRTQLLGTIEAVDYIVVYDELTPIKLLQEIKPHILAKGNNYKKSEVVGRDIVESFGGKVVLLDTIKGISSDGILETIRK